MSTNPMFGIGELRDRRGSERVTFNELADALVAFAERSAQDAPAIDALASYLANSGGRPDTDDNGPRRPSELG